MKFEKLIESYLRSDLKDPELLFSFMDSIKKNKNAKVEYSLDDESPNRRGNQIWKSKYKNIYVVYYHNKGYFPKYMVVSTKDKLDFTKGLNKLHMDVIEIKEIPKNKIEDVSLYIGTNYFFNKRDSFMDFYDEI